MANKTNLTQRDQFDPLDLVKGLAQVLFSRQGVGGPAQTGLRAGSRMTRGVGELLQEQDPSALINVLQGRPAEAAEAVRRGRIKQIEKAAGEQVNEALQGGVSLDEIASIQDQMFMGGSGSGSSSDTSDDATIRKQAGELLPQTQASQTTQASQQGAGGGGFDINNALLAIGASLVAAGGRDPAPLLNLALSKNESARQQANKEREFGFKEAELGLKAVEIDRKGRERVEKQRDEFFNQIEKPLTTAKDTGLVDRTLTALDDVNSLLGISVDASGNPQISNAGLLRNPNLLNKNRQALRRARDQFVRSALRLESGAAIGEKEEKDFQKTFGFSIGLGALSKNPEVIARNLIQFQQNFRSQRANLNPNSEVRQFNTFLKSKGKSRAERKRIMDELGMLG